MLKEVSIIIPSIKNESCLDLLLKDLENLDAEIIVSTEGSRAKSLNRGASKANRNFLWFLHADSRVSKENLKMIEGLVRKESKDLNYFLLAYFEPQLCFLNSVFANIRSVLFRLPYGDQGYFIAKKVFNEIGAFPENPDIGEDLLFVRKAKQKNVSINKIHSKLFTSPRKYKEVGWLKLTALRQVQMFKLILRKI